MRINLNFILTYNILNILACLHSVTLFEAVSVDTRFRDFIVKFLIQLFSCMLYSRGSVICILLNNQSAFCVIFWLGILKLVLEMNVHIALLLLIIGSV